MPDLLIAIVLGVVEGVTEFLPISSTGHLVLCERLFRINLDDPNNPFWKMFAVFIQIGAIAAVVVYFRDRILELLRGRRVAHLTRLEIAAAVTAASAPHASAESLSIDAPAPPETRRGHALWMIAIGSLPLVLAFVAHEWAEDHLESPRMVAAALGIGGVLMILIERFRPIITTQRIEEMTWKQALGVGMAQIVAAIFPGTSRSAATIMGGEIAGLSRPAAAEFSFFLAIPAMLAACTFSLFNLLRHEPELMNVRRSLLLAVGTIVSFLVAWGVIAAFMTFIRRHSFVPFAVYRIVLSIIVFLVLVRH